MWRDLLLVTFSTNCVRCLLKQTLSFSLATTKSCRICGSNSGGTISNDTRRVVSHVNRRFAESSLPSSGSKNNPCKIPASKQMEQYILLLEQHWWWRRYVLPKRRLTFNGRQVLSRNVLLRKSAATVTATYRKSPALWVLNNNNPEEGWRWRWTLLEKPPGVQPLKNVPAFNGTRRFNTVVTWALSWAQLIQSIPPHPVSPISILTLYVHPRLGLPSLLPPGFPTANLCAWPPLWSSGQSSWLQIRRPGFDSRHYKKK
jgi:hypothetical protein